MTRSPRGNPGEQTGARIVAAGNVNVDVLMGTVTPWPRAGTEVLVDRYELRVGGALGNVALALAGLGVVPTLVWDVGDDHFGRWLGAALAHAGDAPRTLAAPTAVTVGLSHPDRERTFVTHLGHLAVSEPDGLARAVATARSGDHLIVAGTFLLPRWRPDLQDTLRRARERGLIVALDTGWPTDGWTEEATGHVRSLLGHVDYFVPNLDEARGVVGLPDASVDRALGAIAEVSDVTTVIKLGADGAAFLYDGRPMRVPAPRVRVVDTVGAGDAFDAVLIAFLAAGRPLPEAVRAATASASEAVATHPRRYPSWEQVEAMLARGAVVAGHTSDPHRSAPATGTAASRRERP